MWATKGRVVYHMENINVTKTIQAACIKMISFFVTFIVHPQEMVVPKKTKNGMYIMK